jgi:hypothetical protein
MHCSDCRKQVHCSGCCALYPEDAHLDDFMCNKCGRFTCLLCLGKDCHEAHHKDCDMPQCKKRRIERDR